MTSKLRSCSITSSERLGVPVIDRISEAVKRGDEDTFRDLISLFKFNESANLNQLDSHGSHPLHRAVMLRREKMMKTMLHYKNALRLDVDVTNADGFTALELAIRNRHHLAVSKLLKHGCKWTGFEEWRQQLLGGNEDDSRGSLMQMRRESLSASCRSEISTQCLRQVYKDGPVSIQGSKRHLLHPISGTHWSPEICEKAVQNCYQDLTKYMDATLIAPLLVTSKHLHMEHIDRILYHQNKRDQALQLLALLCRSSRSGYQGLFKALKEETELAVHQELLQQLESNCELLLNAKSNAADTTQEDFEKMIDVYHGDTPNGPSRLERSLEMSGRADSGIYSSAHSSGRFLTSLQRSSSLVRSQSSKRMSLIENPLVSMKGEVNYKACTNFKESLEPTESIFTVSSEQEDDYDIIEKDTSEAPRLPSPKASTPSAPIAIPLRSESFTTQTSAQESDSSHCERSPRRVILKQISTDTPSTDSNSSDSSYIKLEAAPPPPKYLSDIPPSTQLWRRTFSKFLYKCKAKISTISDSTESSQSRTSRESDPSYVIGCGMRM